MTTAFHGLGVTTARPVAIGPAYVLVRDPAITQEHVPPHRIDAELERLDEALTRARRHLEAVRTQIPASTPLHIAEFIDAHLLMLTDAALVDTTRELIRERAMNAGWALQQQRDTLVAVFDAMEDPYLRTRRDDVEHVVHQVQIFLGSESRQDTLPNADIGGRVVVTRDLTPADAILLRHRNVAGVITERGGPMSHTAILARSLDIPTIMGVHDATHHLRHGETLIVDAESGTVLAESDERTLAYYQARLAQADHRRSGLRRLLHKPSTTADGVPVVLLANLELPEDVAAARFNGASGVGLYRTEFLYMNRHDLPDEEEHLATYLEIVRGLDGIPLTIRTLDLGADKQVAQGPVLQSSQSNPALGLRAIRLCLKEPGLFRPQLRAILRASAEGPIRLMIPMITSIGEVETVLAMIGDIRRELRRDGLAYDPLMPIGGMVEVPAAALVAGGLARRLDFLSIGTNDLIQYTLAIDRLDDAVSHLYEPLHPAVLRLIRGTIEAGRRSGTRISMCGEMAGDTRFTRVLLGLGLRELSMQPSSLLEVKEVVRGCDSRALEQTMAAMMDRLEEIEPQDLLDALYEASPGDAPLTTA